MPPDSGFSRRVRGRRHVSAGAAPGNKESRIALAEQQDHPGDWPWHANRPVDNDRDYRMSIWHSYRGKRYENMLFGDGHAVNYHFPPQMVNWVGDKPNPDFDWW
jgi:hypothetical protein